MTYIAIYDNLSRTKLSAYAEKLGISYKTAWRWWKEGKLDAYQTETGTVIVREQIEAPAGIALYVKQRRAPSRKTTWHDSVSACRPTPSPGATW